MGGYELHGSFEIRLVRLPLDCPFVAENLTLELAPCGRRYGGYFLVVHQLIPDAHEVLVYDDGRGHSHDHEHADERFTIHRPYPVSPRSSGRVLDAPREVNHGSVTLNLRSAVARRSRRSARGQAPFWARA